MPDKCAHCRGIFTKLLVCSICKAVSYCSKKCQVAAWKAGHKRRCGQTTNGEAAAACGRVNAKQRQAEYEQQLMRKMYAPLIQQMRRETEDEATRAGQLNASVIIHQLEDRPDSQLYSCVKTWYLRNERTGDGGSNGRDLLCISILKTATFWHVISALECMISKQFLSLDEGHPAARYVLAALRYWTANMLSSDSEEWIAQKVLAQDKDSRMQRLELLYLLDIDYQELLKHKQEWSPMLRNLDAVLTDGADIDDPACRMFSRIIEDYADTGSWDEPREFLNNSHLRRVVILQMYKVANLEKFRGIDSLIEESDTRDSLGAAGGAASRAAGGAASRAAGGAESRAAGGAAGGAADGADGGMLICKDGRPKPSSFALKCVWTRCSCQPPMKWYVQQDGTFEVLLMTLEAKIGSWFSEFDADATAQYTVAKFVVMCVRHIMGSRFPAADHAECTEHGAAFKNKLMQEYEKEDHVLTSMYWGGEWHALALVHLNDDEASEASPVCAAFKQLLDVMTYVEHEDYQNVTDELVEMYGTIQLYYSATDAEFAKNYRNWSLKSAEDTQDGEGVAASRAAGGAESRDGLGAARVIFIHLSAHGIRTTFMIDTCEKGEHEEAEAEGVD